MKRLIYYLERYKFSKLEIIHDLWCLLLLEYFFIMIYGVCSRGSQTLRSLWQNVKHECTGHKSVQVIKYSQTFFLSLEKTTLQMEGCFLIISTSLNVNHFVMLILFVVLSYAAGILYHPKTWHLKVLKQELPQNLKAIQSTYL